MLSTFQFDSEDHHFYTDSSKIIWVKASPVAAKLGFKRPEVAVVNNVDPDYRAKISTGVGAASWFVNEPGFYQLTFASQHPEAKLFQRWVFSKVLPVIRQRGGYIENQELYIATAELAEKQQLRAMLDTDNIVRRFIDDVLVFTNKAEDKLSNVEIQSLYKDWLKARGYDVPDDYNITKITQYIRKLCQAADNGYGWKLCPLPGKDKKISIDHKQVRGLTGLAIKF